MSTYEKLTLSDEEYAARLEQETKDAPKAQAIYNMQQTIKGLWRNGCNSKVSQARLDDMIDEAHEQLSDICHLLTVDEYYSIQKQIDSVR